MNVRKKLPGFRWFFERGVLNGDERYGGIWDYIPLGKIESFTLDKREINLLALTVCLPQNVHLECLFQELGKGEVERLVMEFKNR